MTLDEAIIHAEEVADSKERQVINGDWEKGSMTECNCIECAEEHRQLAEWLRELKDYRERMPSYEAGYNDAKREIALSGEYERAYERGKSDADQTRWIPVSEGLPEEREWYLAVFKERDTDYQLIPRVADYIGENNWRIIDGDGLVKEYRDILECVAWMPLPKPYKEKEE